MSIGIITSGGLHQPGNGGRPAVLDLADDAAVPATALQDALADGSLMRGRRRASDSRERPPAVSSPSLAATSLLRALLFALGPVIYAAPLAAATLLPAVALAAWWLAAGQGQGDLRRDLMRGWVWVPLLLLMVASASWSMAPAASLILAARLIGVALCGIVLTGILGRFSPEAILRLAVPLAWGLCAASVIILADLALGWPLARAMFMHHRPPVLPITDPHVYSYAYSRGNAFHAIALVSLAIGLWRGGRRRLAVVQFILGALAILSCAQLEAKLALGCGIGAGALVLAAPMLRWLLPVALVVLGTLLPWVLPVNLPRAESCWLVDHKPSATARILIWNFVDRNIRERPILGWGLDASRRMPGGKERVWVTTCDAPPDAPFPSIDGEVLPLHPHNAVLQIWLELGGVGVLAALFGLVASLWRFYRAHPGRSAAVLTPMAAAGLSVALISFGIWQEWWVSVLLLNAAMGIALARLPAATAR
jgi:exopolysaccharide production protein ExoQ